MAVERVSHYNSGLFFMPDGRGLGLTALINGISKPFVMDLDGQNKQDVSGKDAAFAYGYAASPDGRSISYQEDYRLCISSADGSNERHVDTGNPFNFGPAWSPDGTWILFLSGRHHDCHPTIVRADGSDMRRLADRDGYAGSIEFLDVYDFHEGSSDVPVGAADGTAVFYTAKVDSKIELFHVTLDGRTTQLTRSASGTLHYHPTPSPAGNWLLYGSKRDGVRQLFVMRLSDRVERQLTTLERGHAAMWPHWQPTDKSTHN